MKKVHLNKVGQAKAGKVFHEFGKGELHSGKGGKVVTNPKQAQAIAIAEGAKAMGRYKGK
ncbi:between pH and sH2 [Caudoviricetes sp.]|nr:between pH and sH2 [Caudoviricetes sp.]